MDLYNQLHMREYIQLYTARLAAQGFRQIPDINYKETYSPFVSMISIIFFLALCCQLGKEVNQYDVDTDFLNWHLDEEIYIWTP